ncbi:hypothetical protein BH09VER1_BH09VER1_03750 [soil metagenome]
MTAKKISLWASMLTLTLAGSVHGQVLFSGTYTQNFNTLATSGVPTWTDNSTLTGWYAANNATPLTTYSANNGAGTNGLFSFGPASNTDRALGEGNVTSGRNYSFGVLLQNNTGGTINTVSISYTGEQWFQGLTAAAQTTTLGFSYSTNATAINVGTFTSVTALDFVSPVLTSTTATSLLDGNLSANETAFNNVTFTVSGGWANGASLWLRWNDPLQTGGGSFRDNGLSIDNLTVSAVPEPTTSLMVMCGLAMTLVLVRRRRSALS